MDSRARGMRIARKNYKKNEPGLLGFVPTCESKDSKLNCAAKTYQKRALQQFLESSYAQIYHTPGVCKGNSGGKLYSALY